MSEREYQAKLLEARLAAARINARLREMGLVPEGVELTQDRQKEVDYRNQNTLREAGL